MFGVTPTITPSNCTNMRERLNADGSVNCRRYDQTCSHAAGSQFCHESFATQCGNVTGTNFRWSFVTPTAGSTRPPNCQSRSNGKIHFAGPKTADPNLSATVCERRTGVNPSA